MVQVSVSASVAIADGPVLPVGTELDPESYTFTSVALAEAAAMRPPAGGVPAADRRCRGAAGCPRAHAVREARRRHLHPRHGRADAAADRR